MSLPVETSGRTQQPGYYLNMFTSPKQAGIRKVSPRPTLNVPFDAPERRETDANVFRFLNKTEKLTLTLTL